MPLYDKICMNCGKPFVAKHALAQYCSYDCKKETWNKNRREKRKKFLMTRMATCSVCGKEFHVEYTGKPGRVPSTCSDECRQLLKERREQNQTRKAHKPGPTLMDRYVTAKNRGETNKTYGGWVADLYLAEQKQKEAQQVG